MEIYRYLSREELRLFMTRQTLRNSTRHADIHRQTDAVGFCFGIGGHEQALYDLRRLRGIVSASLLIVGVPTKEFQRQLTVAHGLYIDWPARDRLERSHQRTAAPPPTHLYKELCTTAYAMQSFSLVEIYRVHDTLSRHPSLQLLATCGLPIDTPPKHPAHQ